MKVILQNETGIMMKLLKSILKKLCDWDAAMKIWAY
jgi:hypothetical protein